MTDVINWGPTGEQVFNRTYSRPKHDGTKESWPETVARVVRGNLSLVYGNQETWSNEVWEEYHSLVHFMRAFKILPAGRHLWASGIKGRQYLFNCHVAGWAQPKRDRSKDGDMPIVGYASGLATHVEFVLLRLAEGGGVGANYSSRFLKPLGLPEKAVKAHVVCDPSHDDCDALKASGVLSADYCPDWPGAFEIEDTREGWAAAVVELIRAAYDPKTQHEARVFDVSRIRPKGARLKTMGGTASGPLPLAEALIAIAGILTGAIDRYWSFDDDITAPVQAHLTPVEAMAIDHEIAKAIVAGGNRRSARMSICRWDDPNIFAFISCKSDPSEHWSTNISVEVDHAFFVALRNKNRHALKVHEAVVRGMLTNGEPGYWNSTLSNEGEPNRVVATNPCGEIALEPWENCNLGHVNLDAFINTDGETDILGLEEAHRLMTRFLIRATYGDVVDDKQRATLARNRRIGVGHFGAQGYVVKQGWKYSDLAYPGTIAYDCISGDLRHFARVVDRAAMEYCHDLRIPVPVKKRTEAPTGSIAKMPGRTEGIHPIYARYFVRRVRYSNSDPEQIRQVNELRKAGHHVEPDTYAAATDVVSFITKEQLVEEVESMGIDPAIVEQANEFSVEQLLAIQAFFQKHWADNAVSFTVNVPAEGHQALALANGLEVPAPTDRRVQEVSEALAAVLPVLKGTTLMVDGTRPQSPYERLTRAGYEQAVAAGAQVTTDAGYDEECASGACPIK